MKSWSFETGKGLAFPVLKHGFNGKSTTLFVQNLEAGDWTTTLKARTNDGKIYRATVAVPGSRSVAVRASDFKDGAGAGMPVSCSGSGNSGGGAPCLGAWILEHDPLGWSHRFAAIAVEHTASWADASAPIPAVSVGHFHKSYALTA